MGDNVKAWQQIHCKQGLSNRCAFDHRQLVFTTVAHEPNQHVLPLLHHAYDRDARDSFQAEIA